MRGREELPEAADCSAARDCQNRNAPVRKRKQAAAPPRKRAKRDLHYIGDSAQFMSNVKRSMSIARDRPPEAMPKRRPDATETPAGAQVIGCKRSQHRERPAFAGIHVSGRRSA